MGNPLRKALELIKRFEGTKDGDPETVNLDPYLDPADIWTIGWGHVVRDASGKPIRGKECKALAQAIYPDGITEREAAVLLRDDIRVFIAGLRRVIDTPLETYQWAALISFTFNIGMGAFGKSTMLKLINERKFEEAAAQFKRWNKSGGKVLPGLIVRRAAEAECFEGK